MSAPAGWPQRKEPLAGLLNPRANLCAGPAQQSIRGERAAHPHRRLEREAVRRVARRVNRPQRAPGEAADGDGRDARAGEAAGCRSECRAAAAGAAPAGRAAPSRGASRAGEARARRVVAHQVQLSLLVDGVEVDDHRLPQAVARSSCAKTRAPTRPNSSAPVIRMPVAGSSERLRGGQRRGDAGAVVSRALRRRREAGPGPPARPPATASRRRQRRRAATGSGPAEPGQRERRSARDGREPITQTATSRPAMDCTWALVSRWATIQRRTGASPRVAIRLASSRVLRRAGSQPEPDADGHDGEQPRGPPASTSERRPAGHAADAEQRQQQQARPPRPAPKIGKAIEAGGSEGEALELDAVAEGLEVGGDELPRRGRARRAGLAREREHPAAIVCSSVGMRAASGGLRPASSPLASVSRRRRRAERERAPWRSRRVIRPGLDQVGDVLLEGLGAELLAAVRHELPELAQCGLASLRHSRTAGVAISTSTAGTRPFSSFCGSSCWETMARSASQNRIRPISRSSRGQRGEDPLDRGDHVGRGHRGDDQVAGLGALDGGVDRVGVGDLAEHDHVGILAERGAERRSSGCRCRRRPRAG